MSHTPTVEQRLSQARRDLADITARRHEAWLKAGAHGPGDLSAADRAWWANQAARLDAMATRTANTIAELERASQHTSPEPF